MGSIIYSKIKKSSRSCCDFSLFMTCCLYKVGSFLNLYYLITHLQLTKYTLRYLTSGCGQTLITIELTSVLVNVMHNYWCNISLSEFQSFCFVPCVGDLMSSGILILNFQDCNNQPSQGQRLSKDEVNSYFQNIMPTHCCVDEVTGHSTVVIIHCCAVTQLTIHGRLTISPPSSIISLKIICNTCQNSNLAQIFKSKVYSSSLVLLKSNHGLHSSSIGCQHCQY